MEGLAGPLRLADDDRPQARRPPLLLGHDRLLRRGRRRGAADAHAAREGEQRPDRPEHLRPAVHGARDDDDLLVHHPDDDRRVRELLRAADDRGAGHGVPAHERPQLLDLPRLGDLPLHRPVHGLRAERGLVRLRAARVEALRPGREHRVLRARAALQRPLVHARGRELHRHDLQVPGARDVVQPHPALLLRPARGLVRAPVRAAGALGRPDLPLSSTATSASTSSTSTTAARRFCGSTCSGSSATPRSTS